MSRESEYLAAWYPEDDENDFLLKVRVRSEWDEDHFGRMVRTAHAFLDEIEAVRQLDTDRWDPAFSGGIDDLTSLLRHPGFLARNAMGLDPRAYRVYIAARIATLESIRDRYRALRARLAP